MIFERNIFGFSCTYRLTKHTMEAGAEMLNPCKGCEYRQLFLREENEEKMVFCRKFNCERDDARSQCERWKGITDPPVEEGEASHPCEGPM
jgi:hypothetical protein